MLLSILGMLFALGMIALAMMLGCRAMRFCCILVMLGGFIVLVSCHLQVPYQMLPAITKPSLASLFLQPDGNMSKFARP
jgi:hypothetical protein